MSEVTQILSRIESGDPTAAKQLLPLVYEELRKLAAQKMAREDPGQTLQATALVHEAYVRLAGRSDSTSWNSRGHFFGAAAEAMRRILIDNARRKERARHGGEMRRGELSENDILLPPPDDQLLDLNEALTKFARVEPQAAEIVKLRCFAGLTVDEVAMALNTSPRSVKRLWAYAQAWLRDEMAD